ncbi:protein containing transposase DDE domain [Hahella chejuensis KCTC 2396]|uniref:Protein containing transposase DDE domain n=1 Tax=Hahella chejuensis (strain KCTC 2396) TaxID=349521 RepID=Q2SK95_HAHCH|nr:IS4-like element ISHch2 family transposase [Hahella chejuensis]ABC28929.1 protein containing transposase DDE domain [Hahella chejuensis KCTC 2396]
MKIAHKITNLLDCPEFISAHRVLPHHFTRKRHLTFKNLVLFLLNQPNSALQTELDQFFRVLTDAALETQVVTAQAFSKARKKLKPSALQALNEVLQAQIDLCRQRQTWQGMRLLAIDGSTVHLPLEDALARHFGAHSGFPVARLSVLLDIADNQALHNLIVTPDIDERGCAAMHLEHAPDNSLILFDRGYPAHWLFAECQRRQQHFLMRMPVNFNPEVTQFLHSDKAEQTIHLTCRSWSTRQACEQAGVDPQTVIPLRLIRVILSTGEVEVLATSLLDADRFPLALFSDLYHRRWGIESDYRRLKQTLQLDNFSGRTVTAVLQDFHAQQLLKNLAMLMQALQQPLIEQQCRRRKLRWKANFAGAPSRKGCLG